MRTRVPRSIPQAALLALLVFGAGAGPISVNDRVVICIKASRMGSPVVGSATAVGEILMQDGSKRTVTADVNLEAVTGTHGIGCTAAITPDSALVREARGVGAATLKVPGIDGLARSDLNLASHELRIGSDGNFRVVVTVEFDFQRTNDSSDVVGAPKYSERRQAVAVSAGAAGLESGGASARVGR